MKKLIYLLISIVMLIPTCVFANEDFTYKTYDYYIDSYDVDIIVNKNNTFDVTENIVTYFNVPKHGIFRRIPLKNKVTREDGSTFTSKAKIRNIDVNNNYDTSRENGDLIIKIGSSSKTLTGKVEYEIKYTYDIGKDRLDNKDELYYNIIGDKWDTVIRNVTFTIHMPSDFDESLLGFSSGSYGVSGTKNVYYEVDNNTIKGRYLGVLRPKEALTIRCTLDDGYFINAGFKITKTTYLLFIIPILFLIISILIWRIFGKDNKVIKTVEFYPPLGFNSLDVGFLYKGKADSNDVVSLLIYLANKGYIKITEKEKKSALSKKTDFIITKVKDYDGKDENEQIFLEGLFKNKDVVTKRDLEYSFYRVLNKILSNTNTKENKRKIFEKRASSKKIFIILMIIATFILITVPPYIINDYLEMLPFALIFPGIGFTVMIYLLLYSGGSTVNGMKTGSSIAIKIFGLVWGLLFGGIPWILEVFPLLIEEPILLYVYIVGLICITAMIICLKYLPKRTPYGNEMLGKILGFKEYLETAEKDKIETLVNDNPTYFYDILPYTYVLGVTDKWIKNFEDIVNTAPDWYESSKNFDVIVFSHFINTTVKSANYAMSSTPASSSGGISSGGGISGGGFSGGGGGSW